jgi:anti-sigma regulatory factor (Ser/Thr protein kinase)
LEHHWANGSSRSSSTPPPARPSDGALQILAILQRERRLVDARESVALAFRELLMNAVERGGKLDMSQRVRVIRMRARGVLVYRITDPGPGFRVDDLPHAAAAHEAENATAHMEVRDKASGRMDSD